MPFKRKPEPLHLPSIMAFKGATSLFAVFYSWRMDQYCVGKVIKCDETKSFKIFKWPRKLISYPFLRRGGWMDGEILNTEIDVNSIR